tara:strand:- start:1808 stop:3025 length:1218 start_codon:yes stop_codon:yes gene_type:complete
MRVSKNIYSSDFYDKFSETNLKFDPYLYVLGFINTNFDNILISKIFFLLIGLSVTIMFGLLLYRIDKEITPYILLVYLLSPVAVKLTLFSYSSNLALLLILLGFYFIKNRFAYLFFIWIPFFPLFNTLIFLLALIFYFQKNKYDSYDLMISFGLILISMVYHLYYYLNNGIYYGFYIKEFSFISDFGANFGFSIFTICLAIYYLTFKNKEKLLLLYLFLLILVSYLFGNHVNIYLNLIISFFGGMGLYELSNSKWKLWKLKNYALVAVICGIFLSAFSVSNQEISMAEPGQWLKDNTVSESLILSLSKYGPQIQYYSDRKVVLGTVDSENYENKLKLINELFLSRDLILTKQVLSDLGVNYILLDEKMKKSIWKNKDTGMLFLFRNRETFKRVYQKNNIEIWKVQ